TAQGTAAAAIRGGDTVIVLMDIQEVRQEQLLVVIDAANPSGFLFCAGQSRQKQRGQNGNDGDNHQQFNQRERQTPPVCAGSGNAAVTMRVMFNRQYSFPICYSHNGSRPAVLIIA